MVSEKSLVFNEMGGDIPPEHELQVNFSKTPQIYEKSVVFGAIFYSLLKRHPKTLKILVTSFRLSILPRLIGLVVSYVHVTHTNG